MFPVKIKFCTVNHPHRQQNVFTETENKGEGKGRGKPTFINDFLRGVRIDNARAVNFECSLLDIGSRTAPSRVLQFSIQSFQAVSMDNGKLLLKVYPKNRVKNFESNSKRNDYICTHICTPR